MVGFVGLWFLTPLSTIFQYIVAVSFIGVGLRVPGENHRHVASHWQTKSHNVVDLRLIGIQTHNISGDILIVYIVDNPTTMW